MKNEMHVTYYTVDNLTIVPVWESSDSLRFLSSSQTCLICSNSERESKRMLTKMRISIKLCASKNIHIFWVQCEDNQDEISMKVPFFLFLSTTDRWKLLRKEHFSGKSWSWHICSETDRGGVDRLLISPWSDSPLSSCTGDTLRSWCNRRRLLSLSKSSSERTHVFYFTSWNIIIFYTQAITKHSLSFLEKFQKNWDQERMFRTSGSFWGQ